MCFLPVVIGCLTTQFCDMSPHASEPDFKDPMVAMQGDSLSDSLSGYYYLPFLERAAMILFSNA